MVVLKRLLINVLVPVEGMLGAFYRRFLRRPPGRGKFVLVPYLGYGGATGVFLRGRVLRDPLIPDALKTDTRWRNLANTLRRYNTAELPNASIRGIWREHIVITRTDDEGIFSLHFPDVHAEAFGWESVILEMTDYPGKTSNPAEPQVIRAEGQVFFPPATARFGVVSDVDDTVLMTGVKQFMTMLRNTLFMNALTREAFPGTAAFYRALNADLTNPMFYVSSGAWNLYDLLILFFQTQGIPPGPLMLTQWSLGVSMFLSPTRHEHKLTMIEMLLKAYPELNFILIGDSSEHDPYIYVQAARLYPTRIMAIYIRDVSPPKREVVHRLSGELQMDTGIELVLFDKTEQVHLHAAEEGWVSPPAAETAS